MLLIHQGKRDALADALAGVLSDDALRHCLRQRSRAEQMN